MTRARPARRPLLPPSAGAAPSTHHADANRRGAPALRAPAPPAAPSPSPPLAATPPSDLAHDGHVDPRPLRLARHVLAAAAQGSALVVKVRGTLYRAPTLHKAACYADDECVAVGQGGADAVATRGDAGCDNRRAASVACTRHNCANETCANRVEWGLTVQAGGQTAARWTGCKDKGHGLYTTVLVPQGQVLGEYVGEEITLEACRRLQAVSGEKEEREREGGGGGRRGDLIHFAQLSPSFSAQADLASYVMAVKQSATQETIYIDARRVGSLSRFINHAPENEATATAERRDVDGVTRVFFVAKGDMEPNTEVTFDYGDVMMEGVANLDGDGVGDKVREGLRGGGGGGSIKDLSFVFNPPLPPFPAARCTRFRRGQDVHHPRLCAGRVQRHQAPRQSVQRQGPAGRADPAKERGRRCWPPLPAAPQSGRAVQPQERGPRCPAALHATLQAETQRRRAAQSRRRGAAAECVPHRVAVGRLEARHRSRQQGRTGRGQARDDAHGEKQHQVGGGGVAVKQSMG